MSRVLTLPTTDHILNRTAALLDWLFPPPRTFKVSLWDGSELPAASQPAFNLALKHPGSLRRMFMPPMELSLGEAFINGHFDIEGDIFSAFSLVDAIAARTFKPGEVAGLARDILALPGSSPAWANGRGPARLSGVRHSRDRDRAAIQYHYDVGNDFYALWLDRRMQYSCAYFPTGTEDLEAAQERKLEHICRKLRLNPGERLLDIGCGWGGLAMFAAEKYGVRVLGVTLSENQAAYANEQIRRSGLGEKVLIKLQDYRDLESQTFDKIVSVGMFEHVGRDHLPEYFGQSYRLLRPGGLFLNHGISRRAAGSWDTQKVSAWEKFVTQRVFGLGSFSQRYVFPDGELVPVSEANLIAEAAGFEVRDVENLREHYALTLRQWVSRLEARQAEAIQTSDPATYRTWRLFMSSSVHGFESGHINVNQTLLAKPVSGKANLPLSRAELYR
jgi:cyclopropane-fatty-acyl-phospholipid synthase